MFGTRLPEPEVLLTRFILVHFSFRFFSFLFPLSGFRFSFLLFLFLLLHWSQTPEHYSHPVLLAVNRFVPPTAAAVSGRMVTIADSSRSLLTGSSPVQSFQMGWATMEIQDSPGDK